MSRTHCRTHTCLMFLVTFVLTETSSVAELETALWDATDGFIVVRATQDGSPVGPSDGLQWEIVSGSAIVSEDPFTKLNLFSITGSTPVHARASLGAESAPTLQVGIDPALIKDPDERRFFLAGGGACIANPNHAGCFAVNIDVRSVVSANVIPLSLTERFLVYRHGEYYATDEIAGPMRITFNPELRSTTLMTSLNTGRAATGDFFPARVESEFFFKIEMLDFGVTIFNPDAMDFLADNSTWPAFGTMVEHMAPVPFHFVNEPETVCMTIDNQNMYLYPMSELTVDVEQFEIDNKGVLNAKWRITNTTKESENLRIFFFGNLDEAPRVANIAPANQQGDTIDVSLTTEVSRSILTQFVGLGVVSEAGTRLTGAAHTEFLFPEAPIPTVSEWGVVVLSLLMLTGIAIKFGRRRVVHA